MADELTVITGLLFSKGGLESQMDALRQTLDVSGSHYIRRSQSIGTSAEALDIGEITTCGYIAIHNKDATNFVEIRDGSGGADVVKLLAGETAVFRLATSTPYAIANTAACIVDYLLVEA